jgi:hypothetical protein
MEEVTPRQRRCVFCFVTRYLGESPSSRRADGSWFIILKRHAEGFQACVTRRKFRFQNIASTGRVDSVALDAGNLGMLVHSFSLLGSASESSFLDLALVDSTGQLEYI